MDKLVGPFSLQLMDQEKAMDTGGKSFIYRTKD